MKDTIPTPHALLDTMRCFQAACLLGAAAELDLFSSLVDQPTTAHDLAQRLQADERATTILLDALSALQLLNKEEAIYSVPSALAPLLTEESPASVLPGIRHLSNCQRHWSQLARVVQTGHPVETGPSVRGTAEDLRSFIGAMSNFTTPVITEVIANCSLKRFDHLLDIGGASGHWTTGFLQAFPQAQATVFDRPEVMPLAQAQFQAIGLTQRVTLVGGDYHHDVLPTGADVAWLSAIAHQNSRKQNRALFQKIHTALSPNGILLIRDIVLDDTRTHPPAGALFAVNMLVNTEGGNSYTFSEYRKDLQQAGFRQVDWIHQDQGMNALIRANR